MPVQPVQRRPDYGVDGYPFLVGLLSAGAIGLFVGGGLVFATTGMVAVVGAVLMAAGGLALVPAALGIRYVIT
ncbi:MAG: hypothetical protein K8W52_03305, partial [Deltaproteobacteria bacterium]|nr:hypothetical protein [Deltaproteobacteria bacterium]